MITLTARSKLGPLMRTLRQRSGLSLNQVAARTHLSRSAISKREHARPGYVAALVDHFHALGYDVALVPTRGVGRQTGTGWPG